MPGIELIGDLKNELYPCQGLHSLETRDTGKAVNAMAKIWWSLKEQILNAETMHRVCVHTSQSRS